MKTAIIYKSIHHGNTKKIAEVMAQSLGADLFDLKDVNKDITGAYDLIGFGSGKYYGRPHKRLRKFVEDLDGGNNKKVFVFSTSGDGKPDRWLEKKLSRKGFQVLAEFHCKGWDTYALVRLIHRGGLNKGKPDEEDFKNAEDFADSLKEKYEAM